MKSLLRILRPRRPSSWKHQALLLSACLIWLIPPSRYRHRSKFGIWFHEICVPMTARLRIGSRRSSEKCRKVCERFFIDINLQMSRASCVLKQSAHENQGGNVSANISYPPFHSHNFSLIDFDLCQASRP